MFRVSLVNAIVLQAISDHFLLVGKYSGDLVLVLGRVPVLSFSSFRGNKQIPQDSRLVRVTNALW